MSLLPLVLPMITLGSPVDSAAPASADSCAAAWALRSLGDERGALYEACRGRKPMKGLHAVAQELLAGNVYQVAALMQVMDNLPRTGSDPADPVLLAPELVEDPESACPELRTRWERALRQLGANDAITPPLTRGWANGQSDSCKKELEVDVSGVRWLSIFADDLSNMSVLVVRSDGMSYRRVSAVAKIGERSVLAVAAPTGSSVVLRADRAGSDVPLVHHWIAVTDEVVGHEPVDQGCIQLKFGDSDGAEPLVMVDWVPVPAGRLVLPKSDHTISVLRCETRTKCRVDREMSVSAGVFRTAEAACAKVQVETIDKRTVAVIARETSSQCAVASRDGLSAADLVAEQVQKDESIAWKVVPLADLDRDIGLILAQSPEAPVDSPTLSALDRPAILRRLQRRLWASRADSMITVSLDCRRNAEGVSGYTLKLRHILFRDVLASEYGDDQGTWGRHAVETFEHVTELSRAVRNATQRLFERPYLHVFQVSHDTRGRRGGLVRFGVAAYSKEQGCSKTGKCGAEEQQEKKESAAQNVDYSVEIRRLTMMSKEDRAKICSPETRYATLRECSRPTRGDLQKVQAQGRVAAIPMWGLGVPALVRYRTEAAARNARLETLEKTYGPVPNRVDGPARLDGEEVAQPESADAGGEAGSSQTPSGGQDGGRQRADSKRNGGESGIGRRRYDLEYVGPVGLWEERWDFRARPGTYAIAVKTSEERDYEKFECFTVPHPNEIWVTANALVGFSKSFGSLTAIHGGGEIHVGYTRFNTRKHDCGGCVATGFFGGGIALGFRGVGSHYPRNPTLENSDAGALADAGSSSSRYSMLLEPHLELRPFNIPLMARLVPVVDLGWIQRRRVPEELTALRGSKRRRNIDIDVGGYFALAARSSYDRGFLDLMLIVGTREFVEILSRYSVFDSTGAYFGLGVGGGLWQ